MSYETSEQKRAELVRFRLEELKPLLEKVGRTTNNKLMKDIRNQLAHCEVTYTPDGRVFMQETSVMGQMIQEMDPPGEQQTCGDSMGHNKIYVRVAGKRKILYHIYTLEQWEQLYNQFRDELSDAGELIPLPRTVIGCPICGEFPPHDSGSGRVVCAHVRDGIEQAYIRNEFGDMVGKVTFGR